MSAKRKPHGRWKRGLPMRCSRCQRRMTVKRLQADRWPECCSIKMHIDRFRHSGAEHQQNKCQCGGYPFIHRRGSLFCDDGAAAKAGFGYIRNEAEELAFVEWQKQRREK